MVKYFKIIVIANNKCGRIDKKIIYNKNKNKHNK